jgi:Na+/phosphate symporter
MIAIARPSYDHVDNNHKMMSAQQRVDMEKLYKGFMAFVSKTGKLIDKNDYSSISAVESDQQEIFDMINKLKKNQIKLLKKAGPGTKISLLYMDILSETKNLVSYTVNVLKSARDFEDFNNGKQH